MASLVSLRYLIAFPQQNDLPCDRSDGFWKCWRKIRVLHDLKIVRLEAVLAQQPVDIIDLVLAQQPQCRLQILPQQVDLGWCEHPGFCRGSELPTG